MIEEQEKIVKLLTALLPTVKIILFGSRARGTHRPTSDIDIALDAGRKLGTLEIAQAQNILEALNIPQKIELVDIHAIPEEMKTIISKEGISWN